MAPALRHPAGVLRHVLLLVYLASTSRSERWKGRKETRSDGAHVTTTRWLHHANLGKSSTGCAGLPYPICPLPCIRSASPGRHDGDQRRRAPWRSCMLCCRWQKCRTGLRHTKSGFTCTKLHVGCEPGRKAGLGRQPKSAMNTCMTCGASCHSCASLSSCDQQRPAHSSQMCDYGRKRLKCYV